MRILRTLPDVAISPVAMIRPNLLAGRQLAFHLLRPRLHGGLLERPAVHIKAAACLPPGARTDAASTAILLATAAIGELMDDPAALPGPVIRRVMRHCNLELLPAERESDREGQG